MLISRIAHFEKERLNIFMIIKNIIKMLAKHTSRLLNKTIKALLINNNVKRIIYHNPTYENN